MRSHVNYSVPFFRCYFSSSLPPIDSDAQDSLKAPSLDIFLLAP